jgi:methionyl-tRNA formyltransferase
MRIIFMGTPDFSVPTLNALFEAGHDIIAVVAQPDRPKGRGKKLVSPPTVVRARELGIKVWQPRKVRSGPFVDWMCTTEADVAVVIAYGRILIPKLLQAPKYGCINVHASLLPSYRGAAPIHWSIIKGETHTGVCTMQMDEGMDTGDVLLSEKTTISPITTTGELWHVLSNLGANLLIKTLADLPDITPQKQNSEIATYAPLLKKEDGLIDFSHSAQDIYNLVRGVNPWPGAWCYLGEERLKIWKIERVNLSNITEVQVGTIVSLDGDGPIVQTGNGYIRLLEVQLPGKKRGPASNLVHARKVFVGSSLCSSPQSQNDVITSHSK